MTTNLEHNRTCGAYSWNNREYPTISEPGPYHLAVWESNTVWEYDGAWRCVSHPERPDKRPDDALRLSSTRDRESVRDDMRRIERRWQEQHATTEATR